MRSRVGLLIVALVLSACTSEPLTLAASPPFSYPASVGASLERVAIVVTVTNRSEDDLIVNPSDLWARDRARRIYPANVLATAADARLVALIGSALEMPGLLPLLPATLRKNDVLSGFVVFDVPAGLRPVELVFRQSDTDYVVDLVAAR